VYLLVFLWLSCAIYFNFKYDFEDQVVDLGRGSWSSWPKYFLFYGSAYGSVLLIYYVLGIKRNVIGTRAFWIFAGLAILLLSFKVFFYWHNKMMPDGLEHYERYWLRMGLKRVFSILIYSAGILSLYRFLQKENQNRFGLTQKGFNWKPYAFMLLFMIPLITWASTQADFLSNYPRLKSSYFPAETYWKYFLTYEPFYLADFITLEWFFRGLLVLGFVRFLGHRAVLPMAVLYCTFHFGKPMAECISSFFGGYILGLIAYYTKSIWGGIIVHMGIAFMMDIAAFIAHQLS
jgi:membrane protease YdiL (CAAX protease family)